MDSSTMQRFRDNGWLPEQLLLLAVIEQAVKDLKSKYPVVVSDAKEFLLGDYVEWMLDAVEIEPSGFKKRMKGMIDGTS